MHAAADTQWLGVPAGTPIALSLSEPLVVKGLSLVSYVCHPRSYFNQVLCSKASPTLLPSSMTPVNLLQAIYASLNISLLDQIGFDIFKIR